MTKKLFWNSKQNIFKMLGLTPKPFYILAIENGQKLRECINGLMFVQVSPINNTQINTLFKRNDWYFYTYSDWNKSFFDFYIISRGRRYFIYLFLYKYTYIKNHLSEIWWSCRPLYVHASSDPLLPIELIRKVNIRNKQTKHAHSVQWVPEANNCGYFLCKELS